MSMIEMIEARLARAVERYHGSSPLAEMIRHHFGYDSAGKGLRGKRLRPQLLLHVVKTEGGKVEDALDAAVAIEVLHNYSLVHDDIEDGDALRHGRETIWSHFGIPHGINAGDAMCSMAYLALLDAREYVPPDRLVAMVRVLHEANLAMCEGQGLDITFETSASVSMRQYLDMIAGKTGALFAASCALGALSAGADAARANAWAALGRAYGRAFQIRDDVLGTWGVSDVTGKPSGADVRRRKWSFPIVWALEQPASPERSIVECVYAVGGRCDTSEEVGAVIEALDSLGAREAADTAHDAALEEARSIASEGGIDGAETVWSFFQSGARRVA